MQSGGRVYDAENHLTQTAGVTYTYDGDGKRVMKSNGTIYWYGTGSDAIVESDLSANFKYQYFFFNGQRVGRSDGSNSVTWYFGDHLGNSRIVWSTAATDNSDFYPFGGERVITSGTANTYKFTGKERDSESNLDNFGARYNSSTMGRFMSVDPAYESEILELPQTWNRYSYVYNRPMFATDPDGRCPPCIGALVGGIVEGGFDLGKQLYNNGGHLSEVNAREVFANVVGGAVTGGLAVATGGTSLYASAAVGDVVAGGISNIVGGIVTRTVQGDSADDVLGAGEISQDALSGFVGGGAGHLAADSIHVPDEPTHNGRGGRGAIKRNDAKFARYNGAVRQQITRATVTASGGIHVTNGASDFLYRLFFGPRCVETTINILGPDGKPSSSLTSTNCN